MRTSLSYTFILHPTPLCKAYMAQYKNKKNNCWYIQCRNPRSKKKTTIRVNPKTNQNFKTKKEARDFEDLYLKQKIDLSMTFDQLFTQYTDNYLSLQPSSSADKLKSWYKHHIKPVIGNKKIYTIRISDLEEISKVMLKANYSINYINKMTSNIKTILNFAVSHDLLEKNPVSGYKPLKKIKTSEDIKYWTPREFQQIINSIDSFYSNSHTDPQYIKYMLMFGYFTGARKGEIRALRWNSIELYSDRGLIYFDYHVNEKNEVIRGRKNGNGYIFHMDQLTLSLVKEIKEYFSHFYGFADNSYVFPSLSNGFSKPIGGHTPTRWIQELAKSNNLPNITFHGLRHSYVCYLATEVGLTPYQVADRIADTVNVVLEHYYAFFQESRIKVAEEISNHYDQHLTSLIESSKK